MATPAGVLSYVVEVDTTRGTAALRKWDSTVSRAGTTSSRATKSTSALSKATGGLGRSLGRAAVAGASAAAAYLSIAQAKAAIAATQDLAKVTIGLSRNLGLAEKSASQWGAVAKSRDIDTKSLNMSFTTLSRNLTDLRQGSSTAAQSFENLGLNQQKLKGMNFDQALMAVADAFGEAKGGAERQATAQKLLGRGYQTILPLFAEGSKGLKEQKRWADEFGATLSGKTLKGQMDLIEAQRKSKVAWLGLQVTFTKALTPALEKAHKVFQRIARIMANDDLTRAEKFQKVGRIIGKWADKAFDAFIKILPKIISKAGEKGPKIAKALWKGFKNADVWGKAIMAGFIIGKLAAAFGPLFGSRGKAGKWGGRFGRGFGLAAGVAAAALFLKWFADETEAGMPGVLGLLFPDKAGGGAIQPLLDSLNEQGYKKVQQHVNRKGQTIIRGRDAQGRRFSFKPGSQESHQRTGVVGGQRGGLVTPQGIVPLQGFQSGGRVQAVGPRDTVPAMLEPGELVIPKRKAGKMGKGLGIARKLAAEAKLTKNPAAELGKRFEAIRDRGAAATDKLEDKVGRNFKGMSKDSQKKTEDTRKKVTDRFKRMNRDSSKQATTMKTSVSASFRSLATNVTKGIGIIGSQTNKALKALGVKTLNFGVSTGGGGAEKKARGGLIGGKGNRDTVPIMAAPGEAFLTRHQQVPVENALRTVYGKGLDDLFRGNTKPHYMARGGMVDPAGPGSGVVNPKIAGAVGQWSKKYGIAVNYGYDPGGGHVSPGHNVTGTALDVGPANGNWQGPFLQGLKWALSKGMQVLYGSRGVGTPFPNHGEGNHAHVEWGMYSGGIKGAVAEKIKRVLLEGPKGPLKDMGQAALDKVWKAANAKIAKSGDFGGLEGMEGKVSGNLQQMAMQMVIKAWGKSQWPAFRELVDRESSWNPKAVNPSSGAAGLAQALPPSKYPPGAWPYKGPKSAQLQLAWMIDYIQGRYGTPKGAISFHNANNWYAKGGAVPGLPTLDKGGRVETAGVAQVHPGDVHRGTGPGQLELHLHGRDVGHGQMLVSRDEVYAMLDGERVEVERHGRQRARMRGPA